MSDSNSLWLSILCSLVFTELNWDVSLRLGRGYCVWDSSNKACHVTYFSSLQFMIFNCKLINLVYTTISVLRIFITLRIRTRSGKYSIQWNDISMTNLSGSVQNLKCQIPHVRVVQRNSSDAFGAIHLIWYIHKVKRKSYETWF